MYNRYIPRPDGTYSRSRVPDPQSRPQQPPSSVPERQKEMPHNHQQPSQEHTHKANDSVTGFLKQLIPRNFDTGDLIVILLLLLMAGDSQEEKNNAILTIALYFLM